MAAPLTDKQRQGLLSEARAKLAWGTEASAVRTWLVSKGVDEREADGCIQGVLLELKKDTQRLGVWDLVLGVPLVLASAHAVTSWQFAASMWGGVIVSVPGLVGAALVVRAYLRLTTP